MERTPAAILIAVLILIHPINSCKLCWSNLGMGKIADCSSTTKCVKLMVTAKLREVRLYDCDVMIKVIGLDGIDSLRIKDRHGKTCNQYPMWATTELPTKQSIHATLRIMTPQGTVTTELPTKQSIHATLRIMTPQGTVTPELPTKHAIHPTLRTMTLQDTIELSTRHSIRPTLSTKAPQGTPELPTKHAIRPTLRTIIPTDTTKLPTKHAIHPTLRTTVPQGTSDLVESMNEIAIGLIMCGILSVFTIVSLILRKCLNRCMNRCLPETNAEHQPSPSNLSPPSVLDISQFPLLQNTPMSDPRIPSNRLAFLLQTSPSLMSPPAITPPVSSRTRGRLTESEL